MITAIECRPAQQPCLFTEYCAIHFFLLVIPITIAQRDKVAMQLHTGGIGLLFAPIKFATIKTQLSGGFGNGLRCFRRGHTGKLLQELMTTFTYRSAELAMMIGKI